MSSLAKNLGPGFTQALLWVQLATIFALVGFVLFWERAPASSLGIKPPLRLDIEFGIGLFVLFVILQIACASLLPILYESEAGFITRSLWVPVPKLFPILTQLPLLSGVMLLGALVIGEEFAVRGYAFSRLQHLTHSTVLAAVGALMLDFFAHAPLWGLDYTICIVPAEIILMSLYVSERRLLPCLIAHLGVDLLPLLLFAAHFLFLAGATTATNPHTMEGMRLIGSHEYDRAIGEFDQALRDNPDDALACQWRGAAYAHQGDFDRAIKDLNKAIRLDSTQASAYVNRSFCYRSKGDLPKALEDINSALKLDSSDPNIVYRRGIIHSMMGDLDKAIDDFSAMIALEPKTALAYQERSAAYAQKQDFTKAIEDIGTAIKLDPSEARNYAARARLETQIRQFDKALADYDKGQSFEPANLGYTYAKAEILKYLGRYDSEIKLCREVLSNHPREVTAIACVADGYSHKGDLNGAISAFDDAVRVSPDNPDLYTSRSMLEMAAGRWRQVQADLKKNAALLPADPQANNRAAWILSTHPQAELRDGKAAIDLAKRACNLTSWKRPQEVDTLAAAYAEAGDFAKAVKWQKEALKLASSALSQPSSEAMRSRLALYEQGKPYREEPK